MDVNVSWRHGSHVTHNAPIDVCSNRQCCFCQIKALFVHRINSHFPRYFRVVRPWWPLLSFLKTLLCVRLCAWQTLTSVITPRSSSVVPEAGLAYCAHWQRPLASFTQKRLHSWQIQHGGAVQWAQLELMGQSCDCSTHSGSIHAWLMNDSHQHDDVPFSVSASHAAALIIYRCGHFWMIWKTNYWVKIYLNQNNYQKCHS